MFAFIVSKLSKESYDEVQGHKYWSKLEVSRDPHGRSSKQLIKYLLPQRLLPSSTRKQQERSMPLANKDLSST
jgi:hypothetical protein